MKTKTTHPNLALYLILCTAMLAAAAAVQLNAQSASLAQAGLRTSGTQGQFNAVQADGAGNLYLLLDQHDGIRVLKTDATASTVLVQARIGSAGDTGLALAIDPAGNVYVTGTSTSGTLAATSGTAFPTSPGAATSFVAKFSATLAPLWLTYTGSDTMAANSVAATATGVFISGSVFTPTLPVTPSAILQAPSFGSVQNGFVEKFSPSGTTLLYATYLTGASGDTSPAAIAADTSGNAYILGYTTAPGFPTLNALIPHIVPNTAGATSGFLTKLTPTADGLAFSTFIPGAGLTSIAIDPASQTLLLSGNVALGDFPIATVQSPILPVPYHAVLRVSLDGSTVLGSTLLAPGTQSYVAPSTSGTVWVAGDLTTPMLSPAPLSTIGNSYAAHLNAQSLIDQTTRFGGVPAIKPTFASAPITLTGLIVDSQGQPILIGAVTPQASVSLIPTESYDLPLFNAPTAALPSSLRDSIPNPLTCTLSLCPGSAAYLTRLTNTAQPSLALSIDSAPNLTLRNLGTAQATNLNLVPTNFTLATNCPQTLPSGAECSIALSGSGPGAITVQAANATTQTFTIPAITATQSGVVFTPKTLDFGLQTATSVAATRIITITNLTAQSQSFTSKLDTTSHTLPYTLTESASDCTLTGPTTKLLAAGASCHVTLSLAASAIAANDTLLDARWLLGKSDVLITGYTQAAALSLSATQLDFGTQYLGGLHQPRHLYLSNGSDATITHTPVSTLGPFSVQDRCPTQLAPHSVCQLQVDYLPTQTPANDSTTLALDQSLSVLLTAQSLPNPSTSGTTPNPNLTVTPTALTFPNAVVVTTPSSITQTITIGNAGNSSFALSLVLSGDFTQTTNCSATLLANATCTVVIRFAPSQPGTRQGLLTVTAGAATATNVTLAGTGTPILPTNNGTLDLGSVILGQPIVQWIKVSQPFSSLAANATGDFTAILVEDIGFGHGQPASNAFNSNVSGSCVNCWLGIQFKPSATGIRAGTLTLSSSAGGNPYTVALTGVGLPLQGLTLSPITQDFGTIPIRSTSATAIFTVSNLTSLTGSITLTTPTVSGDFQIVPTTSGSPCTATLNASAACLVEVAFAPTAAGPRSGTLTVSTSFGVVTAPLTGYGLPTTALSLSPTSLVFSNVPGPTATLQTITLTNTGTASLMIASPTVLTANFLPTTSCTTLAPAAACTISVAFFPSATNVTDTLQIPASTTLNGNTTVIAYTIPLTGTYTAQSASLRITPAQADFGPNPTGSLGGTRQFTVTNLTAKSLALDITLPRQFLLTGPACAGLAPNANCSFSVTFLPLTNGDITGTLFAQANPTDGTATLNAVGYVEGYGSGTGTISVTGPLLPGNLLNFGQTPSGQSSSRTLTLTNTSSSGPVTVRRVTTQWPFLSTTSCGASLNPGQGCTVVILYAPTNQQASGTLTPLPTSDAGVLTIESDAVSSPNLLNLSGSAAPILVTVPTNTAPLLSYTASQNALTFAATAIGSISAPQITTLANTGTSTLHIATLKAAADFTVTSSCTTILPGASCDLTVYFAPQTTVLPASSTRIGALQIQSDSSSSLDFISLLGTATPAPLTLDRNALGFATTLLGQSSTLPIQVSNTGTTAIVFSSLTTTGDYSATLGSCPTAGNTLAPATTCVLQVIFAPLQLGTRSGTLSLSTSATNTPLTVSLTGTGAQSHLQVFPTTLDFGTIAIGASANLTVTLTNTGNASVTGISLPTGVGDFAVIAPCPVSILVPGASCNITIAFTPSAVGLRSASLPVTSSDNSSPNIIPLIGVGVLNGSFAVTVDGAAAASASVPSGRPANYTLSIAPNNGFAGSVALTCAPVIAADYTTCSLLPATLSLSTGTQTSVATLQTVTSTKLTTLTKAAKLDSLGGAVLCLLTPALFFFWRRPTTRRCTVWTTFLTAVALATLLSASGCGGGGGGDPTLRYTTPGTYQYRITASSTSGTQITQSVTLNLTVQAR